MRSSRYPFQPMDQVPACRHHVDIESQRAGISVRAVEQEYKGAGSAPEKQSRPGTPGKPTSGFGCFVLSVVVAITGYGISPRMAKLPPVARLSLLFVRCLA